METISRVIVSLVYYNSLVRDTLEYTLLNRESFDVNYYDYKRNGIVNEIKLNTPLKVFLDQNGEKGEDLRKRLEQFGNDFYSDTSTVIKKAADGLRVDHAQNIKVFSAVIPLHEELNSVIKLHLNYAKENNILDERLVKLSEADELFYRAVALLSLNGEIQFQFNEFNKEMRASNGQPSPASNFIQNDLNELVRLLNTVRQAATCKDDVYITAIDALFASVEMMNGRRNLPAGKNFNDVFTDVNAKIGELVRTAEAGWRENYGPLLQELIADTQKNQQAAPAAEEPKAA
jgi:hypothetical protein